MASTSRTISSIRADIRRTKLEIASLVEHLEELCTEAEMKAEEGSTLYWVDISKACEITGKTDTTLRRWAKNGSVRVKTVGQRSYLFNRTDLIPLARNKEVARD